MTNNDPKPTWYVEKRQAISETFSAAQAGDTAVHASPSGRYRLKTTEYSTGPHTWSYIRGRVMTDGQLITQVDRNYSAFPFSWCENHRNGHSYLVCGEDYQCQTIIELDTGRRIDYVDPYAETGVAFCWAAHYPSSDGEYLFVDGCIWACPYELVLFDFTTPMKPPYREIRRWPVWEVKGFQPDGSFVFEYAVEVRRSDDKPVDQLSEAELEDLDSVPKYVDVVRDMKYRIVWRPDGTEEVTTVV